MRSLFSGRILFVGVVLASLVPLACKARRLDSGLRSADDDDLTGYEGYGLSPAEERGRRIWYEAVGDNGRFHTYVLAQKLSVPQDWYRVLGSKNRDERWKTWGLIPDPDCRPGDESSYGFDICKGDKADDGTLAPKGQGYDGLLGFVGKDGWKDPGCWISGSYRESDCALGLGTSTGALGYRKFPNPRFDKARWDAVGGWEGWSPLDGSVEPPFLIGTSCGSCHISFNPLNPPKDPNRPKWSNIKGLIGAQYQHVSEVIGSGLGDKALEWQGVTNTRPGAVDTSAHPNDLVNNPGTINAIINTDRRPPGFPTPFAGEAFRSFDKQIVKGGQSHTQRVFNILKGGEDDVGGAGAILRVYVNLGTCSEPCWMNNLLDNRTFEGRGSRQTPFSEAQCRRDCPSYRALEDHYQEVLQFFLTKAGRPTDLKDALFPDADPGERYRKLVAELGEDKVKVGRRVYAKSCASCHSSQKPPQGQSPEDFFEDLVAGAEQTGEDPFLKEENGVRIDWLGNEEREPITKIGTNRCRSLHSNHMRGQIWDEFSSETYKRSPTPPGIPELKGIEGGGRGYLRNVSLLSVWTQAPFLHNNAIGPEICSTLHPRPGPCVDKDAVKLDDGSTVNITSVKGRLKLFDDSMRALLYPETRGRKITRTDGDIVVPLGAPVPGAKQFASIPLIQHLGVINELFGADSALNGLKIVIPKGAPTALLASLDYRRLIKGMMSDLESTTPSRRPKLLVDTMNALFRDPNQLVEKLKGGPKNADPSRYEGYVTCLDVVEDKGHEFGSNLSDSEKDALIAFMKTL